MTRTLRIVLLLFSPFILRCAEANLGVRYSHGSSLTATPSTFPCTYPSKRYRRSRAFSSRDYAIAALASTRRKPVAGTKVVPAIDKQEFGGEPRRLNTPKAKQTAESHEVSYEDLGRFGRAVAGVTEILVTTLMEYVSGYFAGICLGTAVGMPGFLFKPVEPGVPRTFMKEISGRFGRMNTRSVGWARSWAEISAAFGGFEVAMRVVRGGQEDEWNTILSSAAAGAFFARTGTLFMHYLFWLNSDMEDFLAVTQCPLLAS